MVSPAQVVLETLPDYHPEDEQPSYVLAVECRSIVRQLALLMPSLSAWRHVNWLLLEQVACMRCMRCMPPGILFMLERCSLS